MKRRIWCLGTGLVLLACGDTTNTDPQPDAAVLLPDALDSGGSGAVDATDGPDVRIPRDAGEDRDADSAGISDVPDTVADPDADGVADTGGPDGGGGDPDPVCGNGEREPGEFCDGADLGGASCVSAGLGDGTLACRPDCSGYDISACTGDCTPACGERACGIDPICGESCGACRAPETCQPNGSCELPVACGDGARQGTEVCDGADLAGASCESLGFDGGSVSCAAACNGYVLTACTGGDPDSVCGNGDQEAGELCDQNDIGGRDCTDFGFDRGLAVCSSDCQSFNLSGCSDVPTAVCGNSLRETGETCDRADVAGQTCIGLGYTSGTLGCATDCQSFDASRCESACVPACGSRRCGPDPTCGIACGTCGAGEACNSSGVCQPTGPRGPTIITFNTNSLDITQGESVVFSAVVTDPDGIDDVIGGTLLDVASGLSYGSFATAAAEGAYTLTVPWSEMHRLAPINFTAAITRTFRAEFFDAGGNRATRDVTLTLTCDGIGACSGVCTDLRTASNCGACGNVCPAVGFGAVCEAGVCGCDGDLDAVCSGSCVDFDDVRNCGGCGIQCQRNEPCRSDRTCGCDDGESFCTSASFTSGVPLCRNRLVTTGCGDDCDQCTGTEYCDGEACAPNPVAGTVRFVPEGLSDIPVLQVWVPGFGYRRVCDDGFGPEEATVVCRSLGGELVRYETEIFESDGDYSIGDYTCTGSEASLADCSNSGLNNADMQARCGRFGNSVSVFCTFEPLECPSLAGLVINEVFMNPPGDDGASNSEFIELRGVAGTSLNGISLVGFDAAGNEYGRWVLDGATIPADGYFVVGPSFNTRNQDFVTGGLLQNGPASLQLRTSCGGGRTIDAVAWGTFGAGQVARGEGSPEPVPVNETSIGRSPTSTDSGANANDFTPQLLPTPGQANFAADAWAPVSLNGDFGGGDPVFRRPGASCGALAAAGSYIYDVYEIRNQSGSNRTVDIEATWLDADGFLIVYSGDNFDPSNPLVGCVALNDDAEALDRSRSIVENVNWPNGATLSVVLTAYDALDYGAYTLNLRP